MIIDIMETSSRRCGGGSEEKKKERRGERESCDITSTPATHHLTRAFLPHCQHMPHYHHPCLHHLCLCLLPLCLPTCLPLPTCLLPAYLPPYPRLLLPHLWRRHRYQAGINDGNGER